MQAGITNGTLNPKSGTCMTNISMHHASTMHMTSEHLWKSPSRIFVEDNSRFFSAAVKPLKISNTIRHRQAIIAHAIASVMPNNGKLRSMSFPFNRYFVIFIFKHGYFRISAIVAAVGYGIVSQRIRFPLVGAAVE